MYNMRSVLIVAILFVCIVLAIEIGCRIGFKSQVKISKSAKSQIKAFLASMLGMLALLIGFTFSVSLRHYDLRTEAIIDEANAIGTAYLRADLLPPTIRGEAMTSLREYLDLRVRSGEVTIEERGQHEALSVQASDKLNKLWHLAMQAASMDAGPVTSGFFIQSLNELIDSFGRRSAAIARHVPAPIFLILFCTFVMTGTVVGYASGAEGNRVSTVAYVLVLIIVLMVFAIIDLDRPRGGLIKVSQDSLTSLQASIQSDDN